MSLIAYWTLVTCPHCDDLWHDCFLGDGSTYECANCGRQGIGVPTPVTREDVGAVEAFARERQAVLDVVNIYGDETLHKALDNIGWPANYVGRQ